MSAIQGAEDLPPYRYDRATGTFTNTKTGRRAGWSANGGYGKLTIDGKSVGAHRVAWFLIHGEWPASMIDHINGDRQDNRPGNLRLASHAQNMWNAHALPTPKKCGFRGVALGPRTKRFQALIRHHGVRYYLGTFDTPELASAAYEAKAAELRGEFYRRTA